MITWCISQTQKSCVSSLSSSCTNKQITFTLSHFVVGFEKGRQDKFTIAVPFRDRLLESIYKINSCEKQIFMRKCRQNGRTSITISRSPRLPPKWYDLTTIDDIELSDKKKSQSINDIIYGTPLTFEGLSISCQSSSSTGPVSASKIRPLCTAHRSLHVSVILIKQKTTTSATAIPMM